MDEFYEVREEEEKFLDGKTGMWLQEKTKHQHTKERQMGKPSSPFHPRTSPIPWTPLAAKSKQVEEPHLSKMRKQWLHNPAKTALLKQCAFAVGRCASQLDPRPPSLRTICRQPYPQTFLSIPPTALLNTPKWNFQSTQE